jgi:hypothetical protein
LRDGFTFDFDETVLRWAIKDEPSVLSAPGAIILVDHPITSR